MLRHLNGELFSVLQRNPDRIIDLRQIAFLELDVQYGTDDLDDLTHFLVCHVFSPLTN